MTDPIRAALERLHQYSYMCPEHDTDEIVAAARAALDNSGGGDDLSLTWKMAAFKIGEELAPPGPNGYYDMKPEEWYNWASCQIAKSARTDYRGVLPMIISETGGDDEPERERIICSSISGGADYINNMPRGLVLERITPEGSIFAHYDQTDSPVEGCAINSAPPPWLLPMRRETERLRRQNRSTRRETERLRRENETLRSIDSSAISRIISARSKLKPNSSESPSEPAAGGVEELVAGATDHELLEVLDRATADFPPNHPEAESMTIKRYALTLELRKARAVEAATITRTAELLQRQSVAVSERLPGPRDCAPWPDESDASAWCWVGSDVDGGWSWEQRSAGCLAAFPDDFTHWLPAHALPLPSGEVK